MYVDSMASEGSMATSLVWQGNFPNPYESCDKLYFWMEISK